MLEVLNASADGFAMLFHWRTFLFMMFGISLGMIFGLIPGLSGLTGMSLLLPIAITQPPEIAIAFLLGMYAVTTQTDAIPAVLIGVPGTSAAQATYLDGYPMAKQGMAGKALAIAAYASFIGGTVSVIFLMLVAPLLSKVAVSFGPAEYFALMVLGLTAVVSLSDKSLVKGLIAAVVGVMISIVGIDTQTGTERFTFNSIQLLDGIDFLVVALGIFALAEVFYMLLRGGGGKEAPRNTIGSLKLSRGEVKKIAGPIGRSSVLGFFTGVLPGAGATIGSFLGYSMEKRLAKDGDTFGQGNIKGVAAPEAANNAACTGSFVPLLTLGVPGSGTTAVLLGALLVMGVTPGPMMLEQRPDVFWGVIASMYIGNIFLLVLNLPLIPLIAKILDLPRPLLLSMILIFCMIGVYGMSFSVFDLLLLLGFGLLGLGMRLFGFPTAPLILALILGNIMEESMRRALQISGGDWTTFIDKPISLALLVIAVLSLGLPLLKKRRSKAAAAAN